MILLCDPIMWFYYVIILCDPYVILFMWSYYVIHLCDAVTSPYPIYNRIQYNIIE